VTSPSTSQEREFSLIERWRCRSCCTFFPPSLFFRELSSAAQADPFSLHIYNYDRDGFRQYLPADFGEGFGSLGEPGGDDGLVKLSVSDHDLGSRIMGEEFRARMMGLAQRGDREFCVLSSTMSRKEEGRVLKLI